jgi:lysozyme
MTGNSDGNSLSSMLTRHEAKRSDAYDDKTGLAVVRGSSLRGNLSIGVGRNLSAVGLYDDEIALLLANDIATATRALGGYAFFGGLNAARQGAVIDMMFNMGAGTFSEFTGFITLMNEGNFAAAANDLLTQTAWAKEVPSRARDVATMIETGDWLSADATVANNGAAEA